MMTETPTDSDKLETPSDEQAVDTETATDADHIRAELPDDISDALTKTAFSPGSLRKILRDTYYMGPIGIGRGGWRGVYGGGQPGTEMRRPRGALHNFPRSWRYAALERALNTGIITHVGGGRFAATERGVAILRRIDTCPDCGERRIPGVRSTHYVGDPNSEGSFESHALVTYCPECGGNGYDAGSSVSNVTEYDRDDDAVEFAMELIADAPEARTYGGDRDVDPSAAEREPEVDAEATEDLLDRLVENQAEPKPREIYDASDEDLFDREIVTIPSEGAHFRFRGTPESIAVSRQDAEGDIHISLDSEDRLKVGMSYDIAVEKNAKDVLHYDAEDAEWTGDYWTVAADALPRAISKLTLGFSEEQHSGAAYYPHSEGEPEGSETWFTVTVSEDAMAACDVPMLGVTEDGELA